MKTTFIVISLFLLLTTSVKAQLNASNDPCSKFNLKDVNIFIPGYIDTIQTNGLKVRAIDVSSLVKGFKILSSDSSVIIQSFFLTFEDRGTIYSIPSVGDMIRADQSNFDQLQKIKETTIMTIDNIKVQYQGVCYRIDGQVYLPR